MLISRQNGVPLLPLLLNTRRHVQVRDWQIGDGPNPPRNSQERRKDTGNRAINAPQFLSVIVTLSHNQEFFVINNEVNVDGIADAGAKITIYQVGETSDNHGPLSEPLAVVTTDEKGRFGAKLQGLEPGAIISAHRKADLFEIAPKKEYGTSEPAANAMVLTLERTFNLVTSQPLEILRCTSAPAPPPPQPP